MFDGNDSHANHKESYCMSHHTKNHSSVWEIDYDY